MRAWTHASTRALASTLLCARFGSVFKQCVKQIVNGGSIADVRAAAEAAVRDGASVPLLNDIARLGGDHPQNAERAWHRLIRREYGVCVEALHIDFQLLDLDGLHTCLTTVPTIPVHALIDAIADAGEKQVKTSLLGWEGGPAAWWARARNTETFKDHPCAGVGVAVPLLIFNDGAEVICI